MDAGDDIAPAGLRDLHQQLTGVTGESEDQLDHDVCTVKSPKAKPLTAEPVFGEVAQRRYARRRQRERLRSASARLHVNPRGMIPCTRPRLRAVAKHRERRCTF